MRPYAQFFLGSPARCVATLVAIGFAISLVNPALFERALTAWAG